MAVFVLVLERHQKRCVSALERGFAGFAEVGEDVAPLDAKCCDDAQDSADELASAPALGSKGDG